MERFFFRMKMCDDPAAKEFLRYTQAQYMNAGLSLETVNAGMKEQLSRYREMVELEEKLGQDPTRMEEVRRMQRELWVPSGMPDFNKHMDDPDWQQAMMDPEVIKAV